MRTKGILKLIGIGTLVPILIWTTLYIKGKQFALRNRLKKADAIIVLAGTRGNIKFLDGKIQTAIQLYQRGWASSIIAAGKFSVKVTENPTLMSPEEAQKAYQDGRISEQDIAVAINKWDTELGAKYIYNQAVNENISHLR